MRFTPKLAVLALAASAAVSSISAQASSIDLKVTGTITPGSCAPTLSGGGTVDYGTIGASEVSQANFTVLAERTIPFTVTCDAPTRIAVRTVDNRAASMVPGAVAAAVAGTTDTFAYGLGTVGGKNVGSYMINMKLNTFTADTVAVAGIYSANSGTSWVRAPATDVRMQNLPGLFVGWSTPAGTAPIAFTTLTGTIGVQAVLNRGRDLTLTSDVPLDGSTTLEVIYL